MQLKGLRKKAKQTISSALIVSLLAGSMSIPALAAPDQRYGNTGRIDLTGKTEYNGVKLADGASVTKKKLMNEKQLVNIEDFGAVALERRASNDNDTYAIENTQAINEAIRSLGSKGGTVVVPAGTFRCYTIELQNNVNIRLDEGAVIQAARPELYDRQGNVTSAAEDYDEDGNPGNYLQPEVNLYAGLQDNGHTYFANSLVYAADKKNIMIYGEGLLDGSQMNDEGTLDQILSGGDPSDPKNRDERVKTWFGNKAIALVRCENIVLSDFDILNGGHFAIIAEGTKNMLVDHMVVDTNRDAFDIDCSQDVSILDSHFNSLTDDAICFKASYGAGIFMPVENCLVKNCIVSGYDAGSVLAGTYTTDKQVATDLCGPTARIKFGTESTCGYNTVTIDNVRFERSRGLAMEAVDGSDIHDIIMVNAEMDTISSSPIFIRIGNRGRYPVTGANDDTALNKSESVRLTNSKWVLPLMPKGDDTYQLYPIKQYFPAYNYEKNAVEQSNGQKLQIVNAADPVSFNESNYLEQADGSVHPYIWDEASHTYVVDESQEILTDNNGIDERSYYGDAVAYDGLASAYNIFIGNVKITNVDPRYPILLAGLVDSKIKNVTLKDIDVTYRGGMRMADAVEQQLLSTTWEYTQYMTAPTSQTLPWLSNTFFSKNAALLPRVSYDESTQSWIDEPYNVPEMPEQYPEPSNFGILPAYGIYARHVDGLKLDNVSIDFQVEDERHAAVLDDCQNVEFDNFSGQTADDVKTVALVNNNFKRKTGFEYVPNQPYFTTTCENITGLNEEDIYEHTVNAPEPTTPQDNLYQLPTTASIENGYEYSDAEWIYNGNNYDLPVTVHRPFFAHIPDKTAKAGDTVSFTVEARNPAAETEGVRDQNAANASLTYWAEDLPDGASFDEDTRTFTWEDAKEGTYTLKFAADDGVLPTETEVKLTVEKNTASDSDATPGDASPSDSEAVNGAIKWLQENGNGRSVSQKNYEGQNEVSDYFDDMAEQLLGAYNDKFNYDVEIASYSNIRYQAPVAGTKKDKDGTDGWLEKTIHLSFYGTAELPETSDFIADEDENGEKLYTGSVTLRLIIKATPYTAPSRPHSSGSGGSSTSASITGQWVQDDIGWWFRYSNGSYPADQWIELPWNGNTNWYHFGPDGYMDTGWFQDKDGRRYYLHDISDNSKGHMYTGWHWIDGKCYYFETVKGNYLGRLYHNETTPDGYTVDENGCWIADGIVQTKK